MGEVGKHPLTQGVILFCVPDVALCDIQNLFDGISKDSLITLHTPHSRPPDFALLTPHSTLFTLHSTHHPHTIHYTFSFETSHSSLCTPNSTLFTPHFTLLTLHSGLYLHSTHHTLHPPLHTPISIYCLHPTLYNLQSFLHNPHFLFPHTPHSTLSTPHFKLATEKICTKLLKINYCRKIFYVIAYPCFLIYTIIIYASIRVCGRYFFSVFFLV